MKLNDAIFGVVLVALGLTVIVAVQGFPKIPGQQVGPALFPGLIAAGLSVCGGLLAVRGLRERAEQPWVVFEDWVRSPRHILALAVLLGGIVFYIFAADSLGFLPTAVLILVSMFLVLRVKPLRAIVIAVIVALVIHFAFYKLLRVPLPWGLLTGIAW